MDKSYTFAFKALGDFGVSIAAPAVLAALAGKWLDSKFHSAPAFVIILLCIAFGLTALMIVKKARRYGKQYKELIESK